ncbi:MAG: sensor histidine kinase [Acidobacteria bacterium]|nr:sensor histidine kinase [Acidobacteriota bacterium]
MRIFGIDRFTFAGQFMLFSLGILLIGMVTIGLWMQSNVKRAMIDRTAGMAALYVDSLVSPLIQDTPAGGPLSSTARTELDVLIESTSLDSEVVSVKIWSPTGEILYSPNPDLIGRTFDVRENLVRAFSGEVVSGLSDLSEPENENERLTWDMLIETYAPVRSEGTGSVIAVAEFYQLPDELIAKIRRAQLQSWIIVGFATLIMYVLLVGMVHRASGTIRRQQAELLASVRELQRALDENQHLQARVNKAAARTTTLNERFLRRVSADIHDGPAQDVAFALLRIEHIAELTEGNGSGTHEDVKTLATALTSALTNLRAITHGLRIPSVEGLTPCNAARRAASDFARISGEPVEFTCDEGFALGPTTVNFTIYRVVQESLANSFKHAGSASRQVRVTKSGGFVDVEIRDDGVGFDARVDTGVTTLGLVGMRERVELLGGTFTVQSAANQGTIVRARLPLVIEGTDV